ncbi:MAG: hypothetical protein IIC57_03035, partial [Proteobacteria bacterium]|nr:hypothetical protein [Pseudomonadota bacterium]
MVTVRAADLDSVLEHAIWCLIPVGHGQGMAITTHMTTPLRVDVLLSLAGVANWEPTTLGELEKLTKKIQRTLRKRHDLIHALWAPAADHNGATAFTTKARGKVQYSFKDKSAKEIEKIADELYEASSR